MPVKSNACKRCMKIQNDQRYSNNHKLIIYNSTLGDRNGSKKISRKRDSIFYLPFTSNTFVYMRISNVIMYYVFCSSRFN